MSATNVSPFKSPVNSTLDDVRNWANVMGKRGVFPDASVRLRMTALKMLEGVLQDDEPRDPTSFLNDLKSITQRWTIKNSANPDTAQTYESRARRLLTDYLQYLQNPTGFAPRAVKTRLPRKQKLQGATSSEHLEVDDVAQDAPATGSAQSRTVPPKQEGQSSNIKLHEVQLGKDKEPFRYVMPEVGLTMADVHRIAITLAANTHDFDPATSQVVVKNRLAHGEE